jgi:hypothetical protein
MYVFYMHHMDTRKLDEKQKQHINLCRDKVLAKKCMIFHGWHGCFHGWIHGFHGTSLASHGWCLWSFHGWWQGSNTIVNEGEARHEDAKLEAMGMMRHEFRLQCGCIRTMFLFGVTFELCYAIELCYAFEVDMFVMMKLWSWMYMLLGSCFGTPPSPKLKTIFSLVI